MSHHSSDDSESVNVGVGLRLRFFVVVLSSTDAIASLSARLFLLLVDDEAPVAGGGVTDTLS